MCKLDAHVVKAKRVSYETSHHQITWFNICIYSLPGQSLDWHNECKSW